MSEEDVKQLIEQNQWVKNRESMSLEKIKTTPILFISPELMMITEIGICLFLVLGNSNAYIQIIPILIIKVILIYAVRNKPFEEKNEGLAIFWTEVFLTSIIFLFLVIHILKEVIGVKVEHYFLGYLTIGLIIAMVAYSLFLGIKTMIGEYKEKFCKKKTKKNLTDAKPEEMKE